MMGADASQSLIRSARMVGTNVWVHCNSVALVLLEAYFVLHISQSATSADRDSNQLASRDAAMKLMQNIAPVSLQSQQLSCRAGWGQFRPDQYCLTSDFALTSRLEFLNAFQIAKGNRLNQALGIFLLWLEVNAVGGAEFF